MLMKLPASYLTDGEGGFRLDPLAFLVFLIMSSTICFYLLQGSNPGYLTESMLKDNMRREKKGLLGDEDEETEQTHYDEQRDYHESRIEMIELELGKLKTQDTVMMEEVNLDSNATVIPAEQMEFCALCLIQPVSLLIPL
jgi:hypothetical protein